MVSEAIGNDASWDTQKLLSLLQTNIVDEIKSIHIPYNRSDDKLFWGYAISGEYSSKLGTWLAQGLQDRRVEKCEFHWIWNLNILNKQKTFLWNVCVDGLPTKRRLNRSNIVLPHNCMACDAQVEYNKHLFLQCPVFKRIWNEAKIYFNVCTGLPPVSGQGFTDSLNMLKNKLPQKELNLLIYTWWGIWFHRKQVIFNEVPFREREANNIIQNAFTEFINLDRMGMLDHLLLPNKQHKGRCLNQPINRQKRESCKWERPQWNNFKINFDGSKDGNNRAGAGYCIRDGSGKLIATGAVNCRKNPIIVAEARGLREGVRASTRLALNNLEIEGDTICIVKALSREWTTPWEIDGIL